jgi:4-aminobutyrate aminotransferase
MGRVRQDRRPAPNGTPPDPLQLKRGALSRPQIRTPLPGPNARRIIAEDERYTSPSYTRCYPLVAKRGRGVWVTDIDDNEFLDFSAGIAVASTGHCHPEVVAAIQKQAAELIHMSGTDFYYEQMPELGKRLSRIAPMPEPVKFFYANSGAEAIECAIKLARYHTGRQQIIAFYGAFHGRTMGALSLTASRSRQRQGFSPLVPGVTHVPYPNTYRAGCKDPNEEEGVGLKCARFIEDTLLRNTLSPGEVAAIVLEPIQGEGGYVVAPNAFLEEIRRICDRHGILMIADEVQSGAGRTGKWWAIEHSGVQPDVVAIAKGIASGMPLGICMSRAEIMNWGPGSHGSTFGGNPVSLAAALATIGILEREGVANAAAVGNHMMERMKTWRGRLPIIGDVRGRGLMIGIEIRRDPNAEAAAGIARDSIIQRAFERGLLCLGAGDSTIRLTPPLIVSREEATTAMDILEDCIDQMGHN